MREFQEQKRCKFCNRKIRYMRFKGTKASIIIDDRTRFFIPVPQGSSGQQFVTPTGYVFGREHLDGMSGFKEHVCRY